MSLLQECIPKAALIVYEYEEEYSKNYYIENRRIEVINGAYKMTAGKPLDTKTLSKIFDVVKTEKINRLSCNGLIPKNVLSFSSDSFSNMIIWHLPASKQKLHFDKNLGLEDKMYSLPGLVFKYKNNSLSVYAVKSSVLNEKTILYKAPFHNVYADGNICMGNAKIKASNDVLELIKNCERAFFESKFTHLQSDGSPIKVNLNTYYKNLLDNKFDNKVLIRHSKVKTLKDLL